MKSRWLVPGAFVATVLVMVAAAAGASGAGGPLVAGYPRAAPARTLRPNDLTKAQAIALVQWVVANGLQCAYPGLSAGSYRAESSGAGWVVTVRVGSAKGTVDIEFDVTMTGEVKASNNAAYNILKCSGQPAPQLCPRVPKRDDLRKRPSGGTPVARYGPITVFGRVPGLRITRRGSAWEISGIKAATKGGLWFMDGCVGTGRIASVAAPAVRYLGKSVAVVGDRVMGIEASGCLSDPLYVYGSIISGDPRIVINGRPIAVPGSRIAYQPFCATGAGTVK
jgi:uncharacterized Zn-binding protein involved in type VI secretion